MSDGDHPAVTSQLKDDGDSRAALTQRGSLPPEGRTTESRHSTALADLGVLFVHGIGDQREGETLLSFGEPIVEHISRAVTRSDAARLEFIQVSDAMLLPSRRLDPGSAWACIELRTPPRSPDGTGADSSIGEGKQRWVFTEAWWGEQVLAPPPFKLIGWLMTRGPWVALLHILERSRSRRRWNKDDLPRWLAQRLPKWLAWMFAVGVDSGQSPAGWIAMSLLVLAGLLLVWVPLALVMQLFLMILAVLALVPLPRIGRLISTFLLRVSGVLGDSYVLVQHQMQRAAIVSRLRLALSSLQTRSKRIAVVAHSQGSAVVYDALRSSASPMPDTLITFGSGLAKLEMLRIGERLFPSRMTATGWAVPLGVAAALILFRHQSDPDITAGMPAWVTGLKSLLTGSVDRSVQLANYAAVVLGVTAVVCLVAGFTAVSRARGLLETQRRNELNEDHLLAHRWVDICASHDPVPHASLKESLGRREIETHSVVNRSSYTSDHTSYFDNRAEFVPLVANVLCKTAGFSVGDDKHAGLEARAKEHHVWSVHLLAWTRRWSAAALPIFGLLYWDLLRDEGSAWLSALGLTLPGRHLDIDQSLSSLLPWARVIFGDAFDNSSFVALLTIACAGVLIWLWRHAYAPIWHWWDRVMIDDALNGTTTLGKGTPLVALFMTILGMFPVLLAALYLNGFSIENALLASIGYFVLGALMIGVALLLVVAVAAAVANYRDLTRSLSEATDPQAAWGEFLVVSYFCTLAIVVGANLLARATPPFEADFYTSVAALPYALAVASLLLTVRLARAIAQRPPAAWGYVIAFVPALALASVPWWTAAPVAGTSTRTAIGAALAAAFSGLSCRAVMRRSAGG